MKKDDISYEEVILNRQVAIYSSYWPIIHSTVW
jgi:hypothetical protein